MNKDRQKLMQSIIDCSLKDKRKKVRNLLGELIAELSREMAKPNMFKIDFDEMEHRFETDKFLVCAGGTCANVQIKGGVNLIIPKSYFNTYSRLYHIARTDELVESKIIKEEDIDTWFAFIERTVFMLCLTPTIMFVDSDFEVEIADKYYDFINDQFSKSITDVDLSNDNTEENEIFNNGMRVIAEMKKEFDIMEQRRNEELIKEEINELITETEENELQ